MNLVYNGVIQCISVVNIRAQIYFMHAGELQEPSKRNISRVIEAQDLLVENAKNGVEEGTHQR